MFSFPKQICILLANNVISFAKSCSFLSHIDFDLISKIHLAEEIHTIFFPRNIGLLLQIKKEVKKNNNKKGIFLNEKSGNCFRIDFVSFGGELYVLSKWSKAHVEHFLYVSS